MTKDSMKTYQAMMADVKAPDGLPGRVMEQARGQETADRTASAQEYSSACQPASAKRRRLVGFAIAACTVLAIGAGAFSAMSGSSSSNEEGSSGSSQLSTIPIPFDFTVRAYAEATDTLLSFGPNGMIVLDRNMDSGLPQGSSYYSQGYYTGCLFRILGDNVESVTASIDRGQLYSYTAEEFVKSSDPDRWKEALTAKGGQANGQAYSGYDLVQPQESNDGLDRADPNKLCRVALGKLLGSSATMGADELAAMSNGTYSIGLWTNEEYETDDESAYGLNTFSAVIDTLDGAHLTVSTTFKDGSVLTKVIELHSADLKATSVAAEYGGSQRIQVLPDFATDEDGPNRLHTLYGTVVDESYTSAASQ